MVHRRRRGTAVVDTPEGILVVSENGRLFLLPGGGANPGESRRRAAIRELKEETGLIAIKCTFLFSFKGRIHKDFRGGYFFDEHKVFLTKADGVAKPRNEIRHVAYFNGSNVKVAAGSRKIIEKYLKK
ncbi:MAG: NUDIX domain-containing protein [Candidatus Bathyarchaeia archaeon]